MVINTRYGIGDEVYIMHKDKPSKRKITGVHYKMRLRELDGMVEEQITYNIKIVGVESSAYSIEVDEKNVYYTKDELFDALENEL